MFYIVEWVISRIKRLNIIILNFECLSKW